MVVLMRHLRASLLIVAVAGALAAAPGVTSRARGAQQTETPRQVVEITAERFTFTPSEIRTKAGTTLEIRLRSDDTSHGFHIVGTNVDIELPNRGQLVATVSLTRTDCRYPYACSPLCGVRHVSMRGFIGSSA